MCNINRDTQNFVMSKIKHTHLHDRRSNATILLRVSIYLPLTKPA